MILLLAVPDLIPGDIAQFNEVASEDALVIDKKKLQQNRTDLFGTFVQVIDNEKNELLQKSLLAKIEELDLIAKSQYKNRIGNIYLTNEV